jgi:hypothetical protein
VSGFDRILRGPRFSGLLLKFGIDPKRYWLLMDLFGMLTQRREAMNQLGRDGVSLKILTILYGVISVLISIGLVAGHAHLRTYLLAFFGMTAFVLVSVLLPETSNSLINPVEGLILAHQPINGATYTAAKLSHLARILLYFVPAVNLIPALAGLALREARWYYPLLHMFAALLVGLLLALVGCGVFGWLIRFVPAQRLKAAGQVAEFLPMLGFFSFRYLANFLDRLSLPAWFTGHWQVQAGLGVAVCGFAVLGLRSLSGDYLVRVSSIVQGRPAAKRPPGTFRRSGAGEGVSLFFKAFFGGQASRAAFEYVRRMMLRDYQFRRALISLLPLFIVTLARLPAALKVSPFSGHFSQMHFTPHIFGLLLFSTCPALSYGGDFKGVWVFLIVPSRALGPFARGVHAALWLPVVVLPHLVLLALAAWKWGWLDACLFTGFSAAVVSLYLGLEILLIDAVPFSKKLRSSAGAYLLPLMLVGGLAVGALVALQYFLLFPSRIGVAAAIAVFGGAAYFVTRRSLRSLEDTMRFSLGIVSSEATLLYNEVD